MEADSWSRLTSDSKRRQPTFQSLVGEDLPTSASRVPSISSLLRKDLCDSNLQAFLGGSSYTDSPSDSAPDPLLSSFIVNYPMADPLEDARLELPEKTSMVDKISVEKVVERVGPAGPTWSR
ncbi:hypothetical protein BHE74_00013796 [Ensete ventricosum]|nr:hypothetical protein GW17_00050430 [Ensete ventricosum]RWW78008.1 hypothetical protein BHE74_00013796 [Ensete ventricosum]